MEKKNESLGIYYLIILFLILMIIIPPLFRYLMPANNTTKPNTTQNNTNSTSNTNNPTNNTQSNNSNTNTVVPPASTSGVNTLSCMLDDEYLTYNIVTKYTNDKPTDVNFSYTLKTKQPPADAKINNMFTTINNLRTVKGASVQENTNKISVSFYINDNSIQDELKIYTQEKNIQKSSYESLGFKCSID